jgi:hypothetical protein
VAALTERYTVSYAPSGTVYAWLRERGRKAERATGAPRLLAVGDPVFPPRSDAASEPAEPPDQGVYIALVQEGSNAERSGIHAGDVFLEYGGDSLVKGSDLVQSIGKPREADRVAVSIWREGKTLVLHVKPGKLGVQLDNRPAREAFWAERDLEGLLRGVREASEVLPPLPGTRREVEAIAEKLGGRGLEVKKLLGSDASEDRLRELVANGELAKYRYLHFATHAVPSLERAFESSLFLSRGRLADAPGAATASREAADGRLTAAEILGAWKLEADMVVLSACQTALGPHTQEEGFLGFAQALFLAGAQSVVLSLWKVDDAATALVMMRLYENLLGARHGLAPAMPKAEALREAQRWLRGLSLAEVKALLDRLPALQRGAERPIKDASPEAGRDHPYDSPRYWAAFILIGEPD